MESHFNLYLFGLSRTGHDACLAPSVLVPDNVYVGLWNTFSSERVPGESKAFSRSTNTTCNSFPNSLCFSCSIRKQNNGWIVDFPGWNPYCISLMFTIFLNLLSTTLSHNFNVWLKFYTSEVITFQGVSFLFVDIMCYRACSPLLGTSFSHWFKHLSSVFNSISIQFISSTHHHFIQ